MLKEIATIRKEHIEHLELGEECYGAPNEICVDFAFDIEGTEMYEKMTLENLDRQIFFVVDGKVITAPNVMDVIQSGQGQYVFDKKHFDQFFVKSN